jgi:hypothetical protein
MFEVFPNGDLGDAKPITQVGDADPAIDFDRTTNRIVPQGGLESDGLIRDLH